MATVKDFDIDNAGDPNCCLTKVEHNKFFIVWGIEKFSYCRQQIDETLTSCIFSAKEPGSLKFRLDLYPRGTSDYPEDIVVGIRMISDKDVKALVKYRCFLGAEREKVLAKQDGECILVPGRYCHLMNMINRNKLMQEKYKDFTEDKLYLICALETSSKEDTGIVNFDKKSLL